MPSYASSSSAAVGVLESNATPELDWELLYDVHAGRLRRIIQRKVGPAMTEDVLQETFLRAYRNRHTIDPERPIAPWLITIALRAATDIQRRQLRTVDTELVDEPVVEEFGFGAVEEELVRRARALGIKHALASLNTKQRRMLEAVAVEGLAYEQLARSEDMSPDAVKSAVARARTNFRMSYTGFTRSTDLFGGLVGAAIWRLRARFQRYQALVGEHATAFGAATLTVVAVGVVAYPAARPIATEAAEMPMTIESIAAAAGQASSPIEQIIPGGLPATSDSSAVVSATNSTAPAAGVQVSSRASVASDGETGRVDLDTETKAGDTRTHGWGLLNTQCTGTTTGEVTCELLDTAPPLPEGA